MDPNPPTTADSASADARDALQKIRALEQRMAALEQTVRVLAEQLDNVKEHLVATNPPEGY